MARATTPIGSGLELPSGPVADAVGARIATLEREDFARRLWARDETLWGDDPERRKVARTRLGWLDGPARMMERRSDLRAFAEEVARDGYTHVVLLGMGGSSLAPEVLRLAFGVAPGSLDLTVLDNTSPAAVRAVGASHDPKRTLFLVSSKSGKTIEVSSFERHFRAWAEQALGADAGRHFVAITDPDTPLGAHAHAHGYRRVFENDPHIGGRYSALSYFGMVPGALIGLDLDRLLKSAEVEAERCRRHGAENPAMVLGTAIGELARAGRDKVTFVLGGHYGPLGAWIEQLIAESLGKEGRGIVPIVDEVLGEPSVYDNDRVFVAFGPMPFPAGVSARLEALEAAGHPVFRWIDKDGGPMGGEFIGWEVATVVAGAIIDVDPFDEPNVTEAKVTTNEMLKQYEQAGRFDEAAPVAERDGMFVEAPEAIARKLNAGTDPAAWVTALLGKAKPGDYVGLLAYLHRTSPRHQRLDRLRLAIRDRTRRATTLGYGPRFQHSTGQLHKGGPNTGVYIQFTADEGEELPIPGERYGFGALRRAQAKGDLEVLARHGRRALRVHLGENVEAGLDRLIEAVSSTRTG